MLRIFVVFIATTNVFALLYAPQPILPIFAEEFSISIATSSLIISVSILALVIASLILAPLSDRWDRKKLILLFSLLLVIPNAMLVFTHTFSLVLFWRFIDGLFIPGISAILMAYASEEFPGEQKGRYLGAYISATVTGGLMGRLVAGPIAEWFSWQAVFATLAISSVVAAVCIWLFLPPSVHQSQKSKENFLVHFTNPALVGSFFIGFSQFFAFIGIFTYLPFYAALPPFNLSVSQISLLYLTYLLGVLTAPLPGYFSDKGSRRFTMAFGHLIGGFGILVTLFPSLSALIIGLCLLVIGNFASQSAVTAHITDLATKSRAAATSLYQVFYYLGGSLGAWLPGLLWQNFAWHGVVYSTAGTIVVALVCNYWLAGRQPRTACVIGQPGKLNIKPDMLNPRLPHSK